MPDALIAYSNTKEKTIIPNPNLLVFSIPIFFGIVCNEIASYFTSLISKGRIKTITIKKRCNVNKITFKEISLPASKQGIKTVKPAQTNATTIIFK